MLQRVPRPDARPRPPHDSASRARVMLTMSVSDPSDRLIRYMPGHLESGTMRGSRSGFLGDPRPVFSSLQDIETSTEFSACPTLDKGLLPSMLFGAFCPTLEGPIRPRARRASCAACRQYVPQYRAP
jgi:hypothetical protein